MQPKSGVYLLVLRLVSDQLIAVGRSVAQADFRAGWYVYVGSAIGSGGVKSRVQRHRLRSEDGKKLHWQIDYLCEFAIVTEAWFSYTSSKRWEHEWAKTCCEMRDATVPVVKFGSSDCRNGCQAHLVYFAMRPKLESFRRQLRGRCAKHPNVQLFRPRDLVATSERRQLYTTSLRAHSRE
jgi:Uri superfamily endonuclease